MNGDMTCRECGKTIPKAAEYGHMAGEHKWDRAKYDTQKWAWPGPPLEVKEFGGYRPILVKNNRKGYRRMGMFFAAIIVAASFYSLLAFAVVTAVVVFMLLVDTRGQQTVDDSLNGMIEQLRERIADLEATAPIGENDPGL